MKTEEWLRYEAMYRQAAQVFNRSRLVFDFSTPQAEDTAHQEGRLGGRRFIWPKKLQVRSRS